MGTVTSDSAVERGGPANCARRPGVPCVHGGGVDGSQYMGGMNMSDHEDQLLLRAAAGYCRYGYETEAGDRFTLWDARSEGGAVPRFVRSPDGEVGQLRARTGPVPDFWRALRVGDARVLVDMTPPQAHAQAIEGVEALEAHPEHARALRDKYESREAAVAAAVDTLIASGAPAVQTVTAGFLAALEAAPPASVPDAGDGSDSTVLISPDGTEQPERDAPPDDDATDPDVVVVAAIDITITYHSRTGAQVPEDQWRRWANDPGYTDVARTRCHIPGVPHLAIDVYTAWMGIAINGDTSELFRTGARIVHLCGDPDCHSGKWVKLEECANEAYARAFHERVAAHIATDLSGKGRQALTDLAALLAAAGEQHITEEVGERMSMWLNARGQA